MPKRDSLILMVLTALVGALAAAAWATGISNPLEAVSFFTGALCVWLTVKENVWNFPIGLANALTFCVVFFESKLFADAGLGQHRSHLLRTSGHRARLEPGKELVGEGFIGMHGDGVVTAADAIAHAAERVQ